MREQLNLLLDISCSKCKKNCRTKSAYCSSGKHWSHYHCLKLSEAEIKRVESEPDHVDYHCPPCLGITNGSILKMIQHGTNDQTTTSFTEEIGAIRNDEVQDEEEHTVICCSCDTLIAEQKDIEICTMCQRQLHIRCISSINNETDKLCYSCKNYTESEQQSDKSDISILKQLHDEIEQTNLKIANHTSITHVNADSDQTTLKSNISSQPKHTARCDKQPQTKSDSMSDTSKNKELRDKELQLRKKEEQLKLKEKQLNEDKNIIVKLESRCQYLESRNSELEMTIRTLKNQLELEGLHNHTSPHQPVKSDINQKMQEQFNLRLLAVHEKMTNIVFDQIEYQLESVTMKSKPNQESHESFGNTILTEQKLENKDTANQVTANRGKTTTTHNVQPATNFYDSMVNSDIRTNAYAGPPLRYIVQNQQKHNVPMMQGIHQPSPQQPIGIPTKVWSGTTQGQNIYPSPQPISIPTKVWNGTIQGQNIYNTASTANNIRHTNPTLPIHHNHQVHPFLHMGGPQIWR